MFDCMDVPKLERGKAGVILDEKDMDVLALSEIILKEKRVE